MLAFSCGPVHSNTHRHCLPPLLDLIVHGPVSEHEPVSKPAIVVVGAAAAALVRQDAYEIVDDSCDKTEKPVECEMSSGDRRRQI